MTDQNLNRPTGQPSTEPSGRATDSQAGAIQPASKAQPALVPESRERSDEAGENGLQEITIEAAIRESDQNRDRWLRAVADLENFKKRTAQDRNRLLKYKDEELLRDLLAIVDNMDRAVLHCDDDQKTNALAEGVCIIVGMFHSLLQKYGVTEINAQGEPFDPRFHEALSIMARKDAPPNTVVEVLEKGYMYHDRLLRPAKVVISASS